MRLEGRREFLRGGKEELVLQPIEATEKDEAFVVNERKLWCWRIVLWGWQPSNHSRVCNVLCAEMGESVAQKEASLECALFWSGSEDATVYNFYIFRMLSSHNHGRRVMCCSCRLAHILTTYIHKSMFFYIYWTNTIYLQTVWRGPRSKKKRNIFFRLKHFFRISSSRINQETSKITPIA